ncbi:MAG: hypothetical protein HY047_10635 [Acidobacteria bacterium]|nr:hypothetical protein [Acidobacteriota bacterium]
MKTLRDLLRDADPLGYEPPWTAHERRLTRQIILAAPRSAEGARQQLVAIAAIVALAFIATVVMGSHFWSRAAVDVEAAAVRFEVRLAEENQTGDLREAAISQSGGKVYLHQEVVVTNSDIARAEMVQAASAFSVLVEFTAEGAEKMFRATRGHVGRPLAILVDGEVVSTPVVRDPIRTSAVIDGHYTRAEAERIVAGIRGR